MKNTLVQPPTIRGFVPTPKPAPPKSVVDRVRQLGARLLPHDNRHTTCPPAPLVSGRGPVIIVPSIMRSGTHLLLDTLFNNFPALRRAPLFLDFDAYERSSLPLEPLDSLHGIIIKTHFPHTDLAEPYAATLARLAARAVILTPQRPADQVRRSLARWEMDHSETEFQALEEQFRSFWAPWHPFPVEFSSLLDYAKMRPVVDEIAARTGLARRRTQWPVMPARNRFGVYFDKGLTRVLGASAPRVNTTIGYRTAPGAGPAGRCQTVT